MRQRLVAEKREAVFDEETRRIEHDQNFGGHRLDRRLARFLRNALCDVRLARQENLLKAAQQLDAMADSPGIPLRLRRAGTGNGGVNFGGASAVQFTQNLAGGRVHGGYAGDRELYVGRHLRKVYAGSGGRARGEFRSLLGDVEGTSAAISSRLNTPR